jgi:hypothetical protein
MYFWTFILWKSFTKMICSLIHSWINGPRRLFCKGRHVFQFPVPTLDSSGPQLFRRNCAAFLNLYHPSHPRPRRRCRTRNDGYQGQRRGHPLPSDFLKSSSRGKQSTRYLLIVETKISVSPVNIIPISSGGRQRADKAVIGNHFRNRTPLEPDEESVSGTPTPES